MWKLKCIICLKYYNIFNKKTEFIFSCNLLLNFTTAGKSFQYSGIYGVDFMWHDQEL